jgi:hypothetical protein
VLIADWTHDMHAVQCTVVIKSMADWAKKKLASKHHPKNFGLPQVWVHLLPGSFLAQAKIVSQLNRLQATSWALLHQRKNRPNIQINQRQIARN